VPARGRRSPSPSARADLAVRLRPVQAGLRARLSRADVLTELIRDVHSSLDPERVADVLVARAADWLPVPSWLVLAVDDAGHVRSMGARSLTPLLEPGATAVGEWVLRTGEPCCVMDLSEDKRFTSAVSAAVANVEREFAALVSRWSVLRGQGLTDLNTKLRAAGLSVIPSAARDLLLR